LQGCHWLLGDVPEEQYFVKVTTKDEVGLAPVPKDWQRLDLVEDNADLVFVLLWLYDYLVDRVDSTTIQRYESALYYVESVQHEREPVWVASLQVWSILHQQHQTIHFTLDPPKDELEGNSQ